MYTEKQYPYEYVVISATRDKVIVASIPVMLRDSLLQTRLSLFDAVLNVRLVPQSLDKLEIIGCQANLRHKCMYNVYVTSNLFFKNSTTKTLNSRYTSNYYLSLEM